MESAEKQAIWDAMNFESENDIDEDAINVEENLESILEEKLADLDLLKGERENINNPVHLGETIKDVVWEQFINQMAINEGEEFIKENRGLTLDLSDDAHIQTAENFEQGKIATHNYIMTAE